MRSYITTRNPISRDLDRLSLFSFLAYLLATLLLCGTITYSYFTLRGILIEQEKLHQFSSSITHLKLALKDSSLVLSDLKTSEDYALNGSRLRYKIKSRMRRNSETIRSLQQQIRTELAGFQGSSYHNTFQTMFSDPPRALWQKIDDYVERLGELAAPSSSEAAGSDLLWLPVEATAAEKGVLNRSYREAFDELKQILNDRSRKLEDTHRKLSLFSICIVLLELLLIFYPLYRQLRKVNNRLTFAHQKLHRQANFDEQTGLPNSDGMEKLLQENPTDPTHPGLLVITISNLERITEIVGPIGLPVFFKKYSERLQSQFHAPDKIFRSGEREFCVLIKNMQSVENQVRFHGVVDQLQSSLQLDNKLVHPEIEVGSVDDEIRSTNLQKKIANARLSSQAISADHTILPKYSVALSKKIESENAIVEEIRIGLQNDEFRPFYQLKVDANTCDPVGMEALCRWIKQDGEIVPPGKFISIAEKSGLINNITWQLLQHIVKDHNNWVAQGLTPGRIAFNAAELVLRDPECSKKLSTTVNALSGSNCPLDLEITENVTLREKSEAVESVIEFARTLGIRIALDDFGTGYASLSSIVEMDIDVIKVDQSFTRNILENKKSRETATAIIQLARQMQKTCVVEGVENEEEWKLCRDLGCHEVQGFYFYKPQPASDVLDHLLQTQSVKKTG